MGQLWQILFGNLIEMILFCVALQEEDDLNESSILEDVWAEDENNQVRAICIPDIKKYMV